MIEQTERVHNYTVHQSISLMTLRIFTLQCIIGLVGILIDVGLYWLFISEQSPTALFLADAIANIGLQTLDGALLIILILQWSHTTYVITPDEIIMHQGILHARKTTYKTDKIESINVEQSLFGRLFNYGTIKFYSPALTENIYLMNISDPLHYSEVIEKSKGKEGVSYLPRRS